jgi:hypothetical protein
VIERAYTLDEIDRLRKATRDWYQLSRWISSDPRRERAADQDCEERVRTFMMNGTDPAEIEEKIAARNRVRRAQRSAFEVLTGKSGSALYRAMSGRL